MRSRVLTALGLAVLLIAVLFFAPPSVTVAVLGAVLIMGGWEWSAFLGLGLPWRLLYVVVLGALSALGLRYAANGPAFVWLMQLAVAWWGAALLWVALAPTRGSRAMAALSGLLSLVPTWIALLRIDLGFPAGAEWTLFILALAFAADTGAFFAGRAFGKAPLAPRVSPHKTWEGVLGGMLLALVIAAAGAVWFRQPVAGFVALCLVAAGFSVVGDLTESMLKRHVNLKDSGRLFPGHGGVLDRIDSVTAATPVMALGLVWLGAGR
jgi:phosphatidate cytidylyltransferase